MIIWTVMARAGHVLEILVMDDQFGGGRKGT